MSFDPSEGRITSKFEISNYPVRTVQRMSAAPIPVKRRSRLQRLGLLFALALLVCAAGIYLVYILPFWGIPFNGSRHGRVPLTPPWALECWLWEDDVHTADRVKELLDGYARYDLPVRTILIDSPWSCRYNDFQVDETRYPEPKKFFEDLQNQGYRVVLWMTCMVNSHSKDTQIPESPEIFTREREPADIWPGAACQLRWWKGTGGFIDYSESRSLRWWHGMQKQVLDWGVDGWKLDGCDTFSPAGSGSAGAVQPRAIRLDDDSAVHGPLRAG